VSFLYLLSFLDRSNISNVKNDLMAHIGMEEIQYSRAVSVFYIGYILFEVPANIVLKRVPPAYWCVEKKNFFFLTQICGEIIIVHFFLLLLQIITG